jgi:hypothetical protein
VGMLPDGGLLWAMLAAISVPIWVKVQRLVKRLRLSASGRLLLTIADTPPHSSDLPPNTKPSLEDGKRTDSSDVPLQHERRLSDERDC